VNVRCINSVDLASLKVIEYDGLHKDPVIYGLNIDAWICVASIHRKDISADQAGVAAKTGRPIPPDVRLPSPAAAPIQFPLH